MFTDPFLGHASPLGSNQSPWTLAGIASQGGESGSGLNPVDPRNPHTTGGGTGSTATTTPPPADPTYGAGFGSLGRDFSMSDFQTDPGYQWRMDQGIQGLDRSASARGLLFSGGELKALDRYNQEFASNEYNNAFNRFNIQGTNRFNRLASLAGLGQTAQGQVGMFGMNAANQMGQNYLGMGNAAAAGYIANGNANTNSINSLVNGLGSAWGYYNANNGGGGNNFNGSTTSGVNGWYNPMG